MFKGHRRGCDELQRGVENWFVQSVKLICRAGSLAVREIKTQMTCMSACCISNFQGGILDLTEACFLFHREESADYGVLIILH